MFAGAVEKSTPGSWWTVALSAVLLAAPPLAVVWLGKRLTGRPWTVVLPIRSPPPWAALLVVFSVAGLQLASLGLLLSVAESLLRGEHPLAAQLAIAPLLKATLITPLTEESMFRGLLLGGFLLAYRRWTAILLSASLFAAIHLHPVQAVTALASGIFLSWLMAASGNLALPLLGHAVANGVALALVDLPDQAAHFGARPVSFGILGLSSLVAGMFLLRRTLRAAPRPSLTMGAP
jgi:membrane protease YdiL (CAAX protease family)